jgi:hypothetical protein
MSDSRGGAFGAGPSHRSVEIGVAIATAVFGLIVISGSYRVGFTWGPDGPRTGFFPFYIGVIIVVASLVNLVQAIMRERGRLFAEWGQLRQVLFVVIPSAIYVALVPWLGLYVASALLIGFFMRWIGRYGWPMVLTIGIGVPVAAFLMFEKWFLVPLPKGPVETMLGF